jgi:hypothetical protein
MSASFPVCFESRRQYGRWRETAQHEKPGSSRYCTDCLADYQKRMIVAGRCAHPATTFHVDADGFYEGRRPRADRVLQSEGA